MIAAHAADSITLLDENAQVAAKLPYNSGLATAVKASVIFDAIRAANKVLTVPSTEGR
jgi:hypothetical protein